MPDYVWICLNMVDFARICMSMPRSAWMAFVSHVLIEYVFTYFNKVYI